MSSSSTSKKPPGQIHRIREFELEKIHLVDEFDILQIVGEGWFGKILLVEHRASGTEMVLKAVPKPYVSLRDFYREFHFGLHLGIHRNIVTTYDVAFETAGFYVFTQEYAPLGDLTSNVTDTGIGETYSKRVAKQIASALDYMHSKDIVHRDVKLDNVLIFRSDFTKVKLCDFGESYQTGTVVERRNEWLPYSPPEVLQVKPEDTYLTNTSHDVWQFGIVMFVCLTGCLPWQKAAMDDPRYARYVEWQQTVILPLRRTPKLFKLLTSKISRMFRRFMDPKPERRPKSLLDFTKLLDDRWLAKSAEKDMAEYETDELCPSMYSFHSSPDEKNRLLYTLAEHGIETTVDRVSKKNRIRDWIESSVITEEDEEDLDSGTGTPSSASLVREPVKGHVSSIRTPPKKPDKRPVTTLKDASKKHFDPRTGALQEGPSAMGVTNPMDSSSTPSLSVISNTNDSLRGSLVTLGSRNDSLGELHQDDQLRLPHVKARFDVPLSNNFSSHNQSSSYYESLDLGVPGRQSSQNQRPRAYTRTRSDTTKLALSNKQLATSAFNIINNNNSLSSTKININSNPAAFQSLADINKLPISRINNTFKSQSQVKDSGYGSYDQVGRNAEPADLSRRTSNGALQKMPVPSSNNNNYMTRDSAYDRVKFTNSNARRRNYMK